MVAIQKIDYKQLLSIMREAIDSFPKLKDEQLLTDFSERLYNNAEFCITIIDNRIVGIIAFYANRLPVAYITHIYVSSQYRKQGICGKMLNMVKNYSKDKGFTDIMLEVDKNNDVAMSFYQKNGFSKSENRPTKYLMSCSI